MRASRAGFLTLAPDKRLRRSSQLALLPGSTHIPIMDRGDPSLSMIPPFLDAP